LTAGAGRVDCLPMQSPPRASQCHPFRWLVLLVAMSHGLVAEVEAVFFSGRSTSIEAVTFAVAPGKVYVPLEEATKMLGWRVTQEGGDKEVVMNEVAHARSSFRQLVDGTALVAVGDLEKSGAPVVRDEKGVPQEVGKGSKRFKVEIGGKRAEVNLEEQRLRGWQGDRLVLDCRVSSGKNGRTPAGDFKAGPYKARMHYSKRYQNAKMPWSVQINGHIFIHGFSSVPKYPASHGCIRVPLDEGNPARFFYEWIDRGSPVQVVRK
jgi:lipoprotein-anchoring transpeptidase ErfK/SrfK